MALKRLLYHRGAQKFKIFRFINRPLCFLKWVNIKTKIKISAEKIENFLNKKVSYTSESAIRLYFINIK